LKFFRKALVKTGAPSSPPGVPSSPLGAPSFAAPKSAGAPSFPRFVRKGWELKAEGAVNGRKGWELKALLLLGCFAAALTAARAAMPEWAQNIEFHSLVEAAIFRSVSLPGGPVTIKRPPAETVPALADLMKQHPRQSDLYSLKALEEEQKLDFTAAEADWKLYLQNAADKFSAQMALADFYHRRHRPQDEINALSQAARMASPAAEKLTAASEQRSWQAFERIFRVMEAQVMPVSLGTEQFNAWIARYPGEQSLYSRYFEYLLRYKDFKAANDLIAKYTGKFPGDEVFPTRARALLAYKQGSVREGLAIYEKNFQPLWPPELVKNYFDLLRETRSLRSFLDQQHAALGRNPDDLNAAARIFYYYQQQGDLAAAQQALTGYRVKKDARKAAWTPQELYTFARLLDAVHLYPEAARYYFALYNAPGAGSPEKALAGLANILLVAPEQPVRFGSGDLSMYKDIAAMDAGPGYLNGILSLLLNTTSPGAHYSEEQQRAVPYFHRSRAAELVALFDKRFPGSQERPGLHARLIEAYANYGEDAAVLSAGNDFLNAFPAAPQRNQVALLMADSYARTGNTKGEFAIYDNLLQELARQADGVPLGEHFDQTSAPSGQPGESSAQSSEENEGEDASNPTRPIIHRGADSRQAFVLQGTNPALKGVRSLEYQRVLDRYISRLVSLHQVPAALAVWRQELDRNPNDPGLYEKFAAFLEGNQLGAEEEAVYKRAIQQFPGANWYHKLARWYLRKKRQQDFQALSEQVAQIFSGSELQAYIGGMPEMPANFHLHFNQLAHQRFPHNLVFVRTLVELYHSKRFYNQVAWEALLRNYWFQDETLRGRFFEYLSSSGKLEPELDALRNTAPGAPDWAAQAASNPAGASFIAEAELWRSHFEAGAPVIAAVARLYPADVVLGERASSVYRSLAYFNPRNTDIAVQIESNLLLAAPADRNRLARIGDIYSDRELFAKAAPYWNKMPDTEPGSAASYEEAATVFWDYYFFEDALRLLTLGRSRLHDDALYSYQVGAIYETQHDYPRAVDEYVKGSLAEAMDPAARGRLLQLARRKTLRDAVDAATGKAVSSSNYDIAAVQLRVAVLEEQQRRQELPAFLMTVLDRASAVETLESIESMARLKSLEDVRQHALERQIAVSTDPVRRLELRYALVNFYEQKKDLASARQSVEALYKENPRIMGVVRSTADFYWRNKQEQLAINVLAQAARDSYPALKAQFTFEAARKMTEVGQYGPARKLLADLLQDDPYNGEYLSATAETYARAGDNAGLRDFYQEKIKLFQKAGLSGEERKARIAGLRRGLLPALTALKDYAGGVDQYIEIINAYPEDAALVSEAAAYAQRYQRKDQLQNFYVKTVAASPKDSRWAVVLARIQTSYEDFEAAVRTYAQAIKIRPDRTDLVSAKAVMEERLLRFDEAAADYNVLYELAYHDPRWMEKMAEVRARQSKTEQAVQALKTALIDGRPEAPGKYFTVAARLEGWGMLASAREYSEKGVAAAGQDLLANSENHAGAQTYTRIMTRLRQQDAAYQKLQAAMEAARQLPPLTERVAKSGLEAVTNSELQKSMLATRVNNARKGMAACMREMGSTAGDFFTPEEKVEFAKFLEARNAAMGRNDAYIYLLPSAEKAGLATLQAKLLYEQLAARPAGDLSSYPLEQLQTARLKLMELGQQMEQIALARNANYTSVYLGRAQQAYNLAGSAADELRMLQALEQGHALSGSLQTRYFELLLEKDPQRLVQFAARAEGRGDAAVNFLIAHADAKLALPAVDTRSASESAIWRPAYLALTGLYFGDQSLAVQNAFAATVADETIAQRLAKTVNRKQALAGDVWFYYASRYGEYLGATRKGDPEGFLPAEMEHTPTRAAAYFTTALYYEDAGDLNRAISDYQHVVELDSKRIDAHNRLAGIYWKQKHPEQALSEWKRALELLNIQTTTSGTAETFWGDFAATVNNLASRKLLAQFQPDVEQVLDNYVKRNGEYRVLPLLQVLLPKMESSAAAALPLQLSADAPQKLSFLRAVIADNRHYKIDLAPIYRRALELAGELAHTLEGAAGQYEQGQFEGLQIQWLQYLLENKKYDLLRAELAALPASMRQQRAEVIAIQLKLAARTTGLEDILEGYRADALHAPAAEVLRKTATELQQAGDGASARKILEYVFTREIEDHQLTAANMLGLAEIRIQTGDVDGALALLRRMTLVVDGPFENQDAAAALLVRTGHPAQAVSFLEELVKAIPWNAQYRGRLAQARIAAGQNVESAQKELASIVSDPSVPYEDRAAFAEGLQPALSMQASLGSAELDYLARGAGANINPDQPFFFAARMKAAKGLPAKERVRLLRAALEDAPARDSARVPLLKATAETGDSFLAIAVMQSMTSPHWRYDLTRGPSDESEEAEAGDTQAQEQTQSEEHTPIVPRLAAEERAEINRDLGMAFIRTKSPDQALPYLQSAYGLETDARIKAQLNREIEQIRFTQRRQAANQLRQPEIHSALEQQHIVRPRLPEQPVSNSPRPQGQQQKGVGQ
jgi:tetratricopeptide (TPR) repeat protein/Flp pilus assembly protein TadD